MASTVWGIDLGTTYSCIARVDDYGRPVIVPNKEGSPTTPSVVLFSGPDEYVVGQQALRQALSDPENVCMLVKRHMGEPDWSFRSFGKDRSAQEVSSLILKSLAEDAAQQTGETVEDVVITVPAYFGIPQREATKAAGQIAGLNVVDIINEPTAAAFSYGFGQEDVTETVLVYDLGGGTFDVTVIRLEGGDITVVVTDGDHKLGGADWDQVLIDEIATKFMAGNSGGEDPRDDEFAGVELRQHAEEAKRALTGSASVREPINLPSGRGFVEITRDEFEAATRPLLDRTIELTRHAVEEASERGVSDIDRVLLVGGSSFMPAVKQRLSDEFGWAPELEEPNQAVAKGAALAGQRADLRNRINERLGKEGKSLDTASEEEVHEAAADIAPDLGMAAATAVAIATKKVRNVLSKGFGVALLKEGGDPSHQPEDTYRDGQLVPAHPESFTVVHLVGRNDPVPLPEPKSMPVFTTVERQSGVTLHLYEQGGADLSDDVENNRHITSGSIPLPGDDPIRSEMEVMFELEEDGTLTVTLTHPRASQPLTLRHEIGNTSLMSEDEITAAKAEVASLTRR